MSERHELFEVLDAANPRWQTKYRSLHAAAEGLNALAEYSDFLRTPAGQEYKAKIAEARDFLKENEIRAAQLRAERAMASAAARDRSATNLETTVSEEPLSE